MSSRRPFSPEQAGEKGTSAADFFLEPKEPLIKCVFGSRRSFSAANSLLNLEIHTVFLRFRASL